MTRRARRPTIGVSGPDEGGLAAWWFTRFALWRAGAGSRRITPERRCGMEDLDGLVLGGGADVDPALYGREAPSLAEVMEEDGERGGRRWRLPSLLVLLLRLASARKRRGTAGDSLRDELELELIDQAVKADKPLLGICRGAQLLNVSLGGTLHQQLGAFYTETPRITTLRPRKWIDIEPDSLLADVLGSEGCRVNALHHQAVDRVAPGLRISAREPTGVVQAVERPTAPFLLGVQWHPEYLPQVRPQRRIFERLVRAAAERRAVPAPGGCGGAQGRR